MDVNMHIYCFFVGQADIAGLWRSRLPCTQALAKPAYFPRFRFFASASLPAPPAAPRAGDFAAPGAEARPPVSLSNMPILPSDTTLKPTPSDGGGLPRNPSTMSLRS